MRITIGFDQPSYDESPHARRIAGLFGTEHHGSVLSLHEAADLFPRVMQMLDEPFADASILPTYLLCQMWSFAFRRRGLRERGTPNMLIAHCCTGAGFPWRRSRSQAP